MACTSLTALPRQCGTQGVIGGVERVYMISYEDLAPAAAATDGSVYTLATNGIVNDIGVDAGKAFVDISFNKSTAGLTETLTKSTANGTAFLTQSFTITLGDLTVENRAFVEAVMNQPVAILLKTRSGKFFFIGGNGQLELSALEGGTGTAEDSLVGYALTFSGLDTRLIPMVESTVAADVIVPAA